MIKKHIITILLAVLFLFSLDAQEKTVTGRITTFNEIPVMHVLIIVKSSKQKFFSDSLGLFSVQCAPKDKFIVSAEGFSPRKIRIKKEIKYALINLNLIPKPEANDLAIGYGHVKDKDKLYAMSSQNENNFNFSRYRNIYEVLAGNFPGVQVINGEVIIRSSNSFGSSSSALLIVDGREVSKESFGTLVLQDIAQINILKDSSAAVYGVRGANGVVVVETKRGKQ